ncbi:hypothetical protein JNW88_13780 [Micromonospora sp. ATA32]|nr:hypothetical protein [Micromonospora sp. ATA32]
MNSLLDLARRLVGPEYGESSNAGRNELENRFVEKVTFASADEIVDMLDVMLAEDWMALPAWARNLAFRLACLQRPNDVTLLRNAADDLLYFGPDWDEIAYELRRRADSIEGGSSH